jgi:hypothetical protein
MGGDGKISLREAILAANNSAGADTITFAIGSGPQVIHLNSVLPAITSVIHIEGTSQTGYAGTPLVMLDGAAAGATATGLEFSPGSSGSSVRGLAIGNFSLYGIHVNQVSAITIAGNYLGTDLSGALAAPNGVGLFISESGNNIVGGTSAADRNIISGNTGGGVVVSGATATNNVIQGNYIGLDRTGTADLGNGGDGVSVQASASNNLIGAPRRPSAMSSPAIPDQASASTAPTRISTRSRATTSAPTPPAPPTSAMPARAWSWTGCQATSSAA